MFKACLPRIMGERLSAEDGVFRKKNLEVTQMGGIAYIFQLEMKRTYFLAYFHICACTCSFVGTRMCVFA